MRRERVEKHVEKFVLDIPETRFMRMVEKSDWIENAIRVIEAEEAVKLLRNQHKAFVRLVQRRYDVLDDFRPVNKAGFALKLGGMKAFADLLAALDRRAKGKQ